MKTTAEAVIQELDIALSSLARKKFLVAQRLDLDALLMQEARAGWKNVRVVVYGSGGLCIDIRSKMARLGRREKLCLSWRLMFSHSEDLKVTDGKSRREALGREWRLARGLWTF